MRSWVVLTVTAGRIQADRVIPVVRSRLLASGTVAYWLVPLSDRDWPTRPATKGGAPTRLALLARAELSFALPSSFHQPRSASPGAALLVASRLGAVIPEAAVVAGIPKAETIKSAVCAMTTRRVRRRRRREFGLAPGMVGLLERSCVR